MFKKAVKDHPGGTPKPLQSNLLRANTIVPSQPPAPQSVGVKRKLEMTNGGGSTLGSLHSTVYFDENDFDDDLDLDIDEPMPFNMPSVAKPDPVTYPTIDLTSPHLSQNASTTESKSHKDVAYPELPPNSQEPAAPTSSIQYPWSSSPPTHYQPPKPRTLPWLNEIKEEPPKDKDSLITPKRSKGSEFWNKTASAIKDEQREMRREYKKNNPKSEEKKKMGDLVVRNGPVCLSDEQKAVLSAVVDRGKSIFFTGSAGTGKSVLMREIIKVLRHKFAREPDRVAITASTGLAACNIEGVTLHSFAGIGLGKEDVPELVKKVSSPSRSERVQC